MTRRLTIAAFTALAAVVAAGTFGASAATADDYIACAGLRTVDVAVCVEEPIGPVLDTVLP